MTLTSNSDLKKQLRKTLGEQRKMLPLDSQEKWAQQMTFHLLKHPVFLKSQSIGAFCAHNGEMNPLSSLKQALILDKICHLPILSENKLIFIKINEQTQYKKNKYNILEPQSESKDMASLSLNTAWDLDLVLVPLLAIDNKGNRLGMGKGFYDQTFAFKKINTQAKPILIGLAYSFQLVDNIPIETHDIPLDGVATENGIILF